MDIRLGAIEARFADIIWENEPISSAEIVKLAEANLNWKKSTTYTVLKRLCDKKLFQNVGGVVTSLITKPEFYSIQSEKFVEDTFGGSLPAFLAAFTSRKSLSVAEIEDLRRMVSEHENTEEQQ